MLVTPSPKSHWYAVASSAAEVKLVKVTVSGLEPSRGVALNSASGKRQQRLQAELTYFRNQWPRMNYPEYLRLNLPIASGVVEAACKTLITQRFKRSGMAWTVAGGQAILTLRSLIQSQRWSPAWNLLAADFRQAITIVKLATAQQVQNSRAVARVVILFRVEYLAACRASTLAKLLIPRDLPRGSSFFHPVTQQETDVAHYP